jgi:hypothetical protein
MTTFELPPGTRVELSAAYLAGWLDATGAVELHPLGHLPGDPREIAAELLTSVRFREVAESIAFELDAGSLAVWLGLTARTTCAIPAVKGSLAGSLALVDVRWEDVDDPGVYAVATSGRLAGEGTAALAGGEVSCRVDVALAGTLLPDWQRIMADAGDAGWTGAARILARDGTTTVLPVDLADLVASAEALSMPLEPAAGLARAAAAGVEPADGAGGERAGAELRAAATAYARGYAATLTGAAPVEGPGSAAAERQIEEISERTNAAPERVVAAIVAAQGGYAAIYERSLDRLREALFAEASAALDPAVRVGWIEDLGGEWSPEGNARERLRASLFAAEDA